MIILLATQLLGTIISSFAVLYQRRYNKLHKSIYGLSYDTALLNIIALLVNIYVSINYKFNPIVNDQLYARFPIFYKGWYDIPVSITLLIADVAQLFCYFVIWKQLSLYKVTRHIYQGISLICISVVFIMVGFIGTLTLYFSFFDVHHFVYLDHLNIIWVMGNGIKSVTLCSQICINWMGQCCVGVSSRYIITAIVANIIQFIGFIASNTNNNINFWEWPFNSIPILITSTELICLFIIFYQAEFVYRGNKPSLPKQIDNLSTIV